MSAPFAFPRRGCVKCNVRRLRGGGSLIWRNRMSPLRIIEQNVQLPSQCCFPLSPLLLLCLLRPRPLLYIYTSRALPSPLTRRRSSGVGPCSIPLLLRVNSPSLVPPIVSYLIRSTLRVYSQSSPSGSLSIFPSPIWIKTEAGAVSTDPPRHPQAHMPRIQTIPQQAPDQRTTPIIII